MEYAEERLKRRKHGHHHHQNRNHHRRRHRSSKDKEEKTAISTLDFEGEKADEVEVEERNLENKGNGDGIYPEEALVSGASGFARVDYEMEEGEIVEDDGLIDFVNHDSDISRKNLHSDVESGEIVTNRNGHFDMVCSYFCSSCFTSSFIFVMHVSLRPYFVKTVHLFTTEPG